MKAKKEKQDKGEKQRRGPSLSAIAALITLAASLWLQVELSSALFRSVLVYLGLSMVGLFYRAILGHYLAASETRAHQEMLNKLAREAEEEMRKQAEEQKQKAKNEKLKTKQEKAPAPTNQ